MRLHFLTTCLATALIVALSPHSAIAQQEPQRPSVSGTWITPPEHVTVLPLPENGKAGVGAKGKDRIKIVEKDGMLTISGGDVTDTFALDGSETTNCSRSQGSCIPTKCRGRRDNGLLVLSCRIIHAGGQETLTTEKLILDADGNLQIEFRIVGKGFNTVARSTYMRQLPLVFELGEQ